MIYLIAESTIDELKQTAISGIVQNTMAERDKHNNRLELSSAIHNNKENFLEISFNVSPTYGGSGVYHSTLRFYKVNNKFNMPIQGLRYSAIEAILKDIIHNCDVKLYSDDPSFLWQGVWEGLSDNKLSIYRYNGQDGDGVWDEKHKASGGIENEHIHITKHLAQIIRDIDNYITPISQILEEKY